MLDVNGGIALAFESLRRGPKNRRQTITEAAFSAFRLSTSCDGGRGFVPEHDPTLVRSPDKDHAQK